MSRTVVAMSGGVDSSVAAALLAQAGREVVGITMNLAGSRSRCCSLEDADDARRVAETLGIPFYVANYGDAFRSEVMEAFADSYLAGETPIPCVSCNQRFKFDHLLQRAAALDADAVATGHYARIDSDPATGKRRLRVAVDLAKDQTYFLFGLTQAQLANAMFPLGELTKDAVRERARELGLATAEKPESQEICFVPDGDYAAVVEKIRPGAAPGSGEIVDGQGRVLGTHSGIHHFTVGQRRGLGVSAATPLYVTEVDAVHNRIVVGNVQALERSGARVQRINWISGDAPKQPIHAKVRIRYRHAGASARIVPETDTAARVEFDSPVRAVTPGQAAVFYADDVVLGGGWIAGAIR